MHSRFFAFSFLAVSPSGPHVHIRRGIRTIEWRARRRRRAAHQNERKLDAITHPLYMTTVKPRPRPLVLVLLLLCCCGAVSLTCSPYKTQLTPLLLCCAAKRYALALLILLLLVACRTRISPPLQKSPRIRGGERRLKFCFDALNPE